MIVQGNDDKMASGEIWNQCCQLLQNSYYPGENGLKWNLFHVLNVYFMFYQIRLLFLEG